MPSRQYRKSGGPLRHLSPAVMVVAAALVMTTCVLGVVIWKALDAKTTTLARGRADTMNLAHSLAEHATHAIQSADIAMAGIVELLKYRDLVPERFNRHLAQTARSLPQLREIGVFDANGKLLYSSLLQRPLHDASDRLYFAHHRDTPGQALRINEAQPSDLTGRSAILLSKRFDRQDGSFGGVLTATIDSDYFNQFYRTFQLGPDGSISLVRDDGAVLIRWPVPDKNTNLASTELYSRHLAQTPSGHYRITSPFDGIDKYIGHQGTRHYGMVVTVAITEEWMLAEWRKTLRTDAIVSAAVAFMILLLAGILFAQFRFRMRTERALREREAHYRLLADNIADVIILIDARGLVRYVSQSVGPVLGQRPEDLLGRACFDMIHPADRKMVMSATGQLSGIDKVSTVLFRTWRADGALVWVESRFKLVALPDDPAQAEFLCVIRDVTERKRMEDELNQLNRRLTQLAATDGLTGLTNRRAFDDFLQRQFESCDEISVLLLDIDGFKGFNDTYGHQAGDRCLQAVAKVIGDATFDTSGLSARYGGEEFAVVLPDTGEDEALKVAEKIRLAVRALGIANPASSRRYITLSIGVAARTDAMRDDSALVGEADAALYEAKRLGRNRSFVASLLRLHHVESASIQHDAGLVPQPRTAST